VGAGADASVVVGGGVVVVAVGRVAVGCTMTGRTVGGVGVVDVVGASDGRVVVGSTITGDVVAVVVNDGGSVVVVVVGSTITGPAVVVVVGVAKPDAVRPRTGATANELATTIPEAISRRIMGRRWHEASISVTLSSL
jgi:hypothetical protein